MILLVYSYAKENIQTILYMTPNILYNKRYQNIKYFMLLSISKKIIKNCEA